jgi:hypothetical protein
MLTSRLKINKNSSAQPTKLGISNDEKSGINGKNLSGIQRLNEIKIPNRKNAEVTTAIV